MAPPSPFPLILSYLLVVFLSLAIFANATTIDVFNNCPYTVWAAASPGGGKQLNQGETWQLNPAPGTKMARVWPRTGCNFDDSGHGRCITGDCGGLLECQIWGEDPSSLAEYALAQPNNPTDTFDLSFIQGFNVPIDFSPVNAPLTDKCHGIRCSANLVGMCPPDLQTPGGCNNPCKVYGGVKYCCNSVRGSCGPTPGSQFFKTNCPDAYSYPQDDPSSTFSCPNGTNYKITFCP